jgi:hypothetical protein
VNRRMRTRMYGGVRGGVSDGSAYSIRLIGSSAHRFGFNSFELTRNDFVLKWLSLLPAVLRNYALTGLG